MDGSRFARLVRITLCVTFLLPALAGCRKKKPAAVEEPVAFAHELPPGELALRKISPAEYPDFTPLGQ
jgi:hypothetical protein